MAAFAFSWNRSWSDTLDGGILAVQASQRRSSGSKGANPLGELMTARVFQPPLSSLEATLAWLPKELRLTSLCLLFIAHAQFPSTMCYRSEPSVAACSVLNAGQLPAPSEAPLFRRSTLNVPVLAASDGGSSFCSCRMLTLYIVAKLTGPVCGPFSLLHKQ
jgi:hypothetical protein